MIVTILFLAIVGALAALLLFVVSKKFHVEEDARIELVNEALPGANCGGCGYPGCSGFARACVEAESMEGLFCTVGGNDTMLKVADILGRTAVEAEPQLAVVRCNGTCDARPKVNQYDGDSSCAIAAATYGGETGCTFGCLGLGDCTLACGFDAIKMNPLTGLP